MRLLAIGDIHGQLERLNRLLARVRPRPDDQVVLLGDYIDRGPDAKGVIDALLKLRGAAPRTVFLRGNHEQMLLDSLFELGIMSDWKPLRAYAGSPDLSLSTDRFLFEMNGGLATLLSYVGAAPQPFADRESAYRMIPRRHVDFLKQTALYYRYRNFLFVHAGINARDPLGERQGPYDLLWRRRVDPCRIGAQAVTVVHGHTPCREPLFTEREINLDTGAGHGRLLSCCDLLTGKVWQA
ncbi:MAG TPA: metallophosphoesterase family protein [Geopsychrobacteraceae bacterium]|jgi:serine/threonine protein phosphatase 1